MKVNVKLSTGLPVVLAVVLGACGTTLDRAVTVAPAAAASDALPAADDSGLPSAAALVSRYVEAVGGEKAIRRHSSMQMRGTFELVSMGLNGDLTIFSAAPNLVLVRIENVPGVGSIETGFDGEVAWTDTPMTGPALIEGEARDDTIRLADFYAELNYAELYPTMATVEETVFNQTSVYKVRCEDRGGKESFHYFDTKSGLLVGTEGEQQTPMGRVFVSSSFQDYKSFGGRLLATRVTEAVMGMEQKMTVTEVELGGVDAEVFVLPPQIKTLVESE